MRRHIKQFFEADSASGITLLVFLLLSLIVANSPFGPGFESLLAQEIGLESGVVHLRYSILLWINDGLMAVFFLMVGIEIKQELAHGQLSSAKKASLPFFAALGGMLVPAGIYTLFNAGTETSSGWGIPMATDIAFAIGILSLLGKRVPVALKVFLTALAIVDDLGAILVIALFYTSDLQASYLLYALGVFVLLTFMNRMGIKSLWLYLIPGLFIWYLIHHSGVHATIAGVLTAFAIPIQGKKAGHSPIQQVEHAISTPVNFIIMPLFALANTNIRFENDMIDGLASPLGLGIIAGLFVGKPLGITLLSWIAVKFRVSELPKNTKWLQILAIGLMGGIGFTMSIFIALLSFADLYHQTEAKFAILVASALSGVIGYLVLKRLGRKGISTQ
ncbi:Na+/H+ antiporter NhaA [Parapedobacter koreensis]|uniref:Na(+)/H(+) antiporter NhaA n=1 Tax=Parapedobacter koreensis TaxID=332977 RepID=A0A1H7Q8X9_9SPHI|nr:Na+/H+ antiporter NhaA [Parapedobacter koreensis]SEL44432.1 sodium/proton antiporter, NhaA family [Parapedobacter koreensis]